ncbi:MAG: cyclic-di-AMP receptor [Oscillospiraceae bacterium]|nr:cyclic-di-AMP receptor [Oscillospiraceae bacterium]
MKLIVAVVSDEDGGKVIEGLSGSGFMATRINSSGGFLRAGNTTLLIGLSEDRLDEAVAIISEHSKSRKKVIDSSITPSNVGGVFMPYPIEIVVGGATMFIIRMDGFHKVTSPERGED